MKQLICIVRLPEMYSVCVCVCVVTYMLRCEKDKAGSSRHALGLHLWEILVPCDHHTVHVGDSTPC